MAGALQRRPWCIQEVGSAAQVDDPAGDRTQDLRIKSPLLYQLSYRVCNDLALDRCLMFPRLFPRHSTAVPG